jgi:hypothetical protein
MKFVTGLLAAVLLLAGVNASHAAIRITDDHGGQIGTYVDKYRGLRTSGKTVIIDGLCASASDSTTTIPAMMSPKACRSWPPTDYRRTTPSLHPAAIRFPSGEYPIE